MTLRVLVADDSSTMRKIIIRSLLAVGAPGATEAADGAEAVALFKPGAFDLVLTDWNMPGKSGLEVVQAIRLVKQGIEKYATAKGNHRDPFKLGAKLPENECYLETECPRGQMGFYIVGKGDAEPLRTRAKSSCFCNLSVSGPLCQGVLLADVPAIVGSLDIVMGEIDR